MLCVCVWHTLVENFVKYNHLLSEVYIHREGQTNRYIREDVCIRKNRKWIRQVISGFSCWVGTPCLTPSGLGVQMPPLLCLFAVLPHLVDFFWVLQVFRLTGVFKLSIVCCVCTCGLQKVGVLCNVSSP